MPGAMDSIHLYGIVLFLLVWAATQTIHNLFFHPLRDVPGPLLAKVSSLWLLFHELGGQAHLHIMKLHYHYGPVIRISPNEVSFNDLASFNQVYSQGTRFDKAKYFYRPFREEEDNIFTLSDREKHVEDKRLLAHGFSQAKILQHESLIHDYVRKFVGRMKPYAQSRKEFPLLSGFRCMTLDLISQFLFGADPKALELKDFHDPDHDLSDASFINFSQHFPPARPISAVLNRFGIPNPGSVSGVASFGRAAQRGLEVMKSLPHLEWTLFKAMREYASKRDKHISDKQIISEGATLLVAGMDTTAVTLTTTIYNLVKNPDLFEKLYQEVRQVMPTPTSRPPYHQLDQLPFLDACVKEGTRVATPVRSRLPRVVPEGGWMSHGRTYKPGTIVGSSSLYLHRDPCVFPDPEAFKPDRWLVSEEARKELLQYYQPFSRGARACLGQNLTVIEQKIALAAMVTNFTPIKVSSSKIEWYEAVTNAVPDSLVYVTMGCRD